MENPPEFLTKRETIQDEKIFQPAYANRRGELIAWISAVVIGLLLTIFYFVTREVQCLTAGLFIFFLAAALLITFGLWVDSKTFAKVSPQYLHYKSPFREVRLEWDQVEELRAIEAGSVWRVVVFGAGRYFRIRVLESEEEIEQGRRFLVIPQADRLVRIICGMAKLRYPRESEEEWICKRA
jgi:hypothetical protein